MLLSRLFQLKRKMQASMAGNVDRSVHFTGRRYVKLSKSALVGERTWFNVNARSEGGNIFIHDNCYIGKANFFSSARRIELQAFTMTSINCLFLGSGHDFSNPFNPYLQGTTDSTGEIIVEPNVMFGAGCVLIGNVRVGYGSVLSAGTSVRNASIPPLSLVAGNPAKVVKRFDLQNRIWADPASIPEGAPYPSVDEYLEELNRNWKTDTRGLRVTLGRAAGNLND